MILPYSVKNSLSYIVPCQQNNPGMAERRLVSVSGNRCLVPWSVDASEGFDTILDAETTKVCNSNHGVIISLTMQ